MIVIPEIRLDVCSLVIFFIDTKANKLWKTFHNANKTIIKWRGSKQICLLFFIRFIFVLIYVYVSGSVYATCCVGTLQGQRLTSDPPTLGISSAVILVLFYIFFFFVSVWDRISHCSTFWPRTYSVAQAGFEFGAFLLLQPSSACIKGMHYYTWFFSWCWAKLEYEYKCKTSDKAVKEWCDFENF